MTLDEFFEISLLCVVRYQPRHVHAAQNTFFFLSQIAVKPSAVDPVRHGVRHHERGGDGNVQRLGEAKHRNVHGAIPQRSRLVRNPLALVPKHHRRGHGPIVMRQRLRAVKLSRENAVSFRLRDSERAFRRLKLLHVLPLQRPSRRPPARLERQPLRAHDRRAPDPQRLRRPTHRQDIADVVDAL